MKSDAIATAELNKIIAEKDAEIAGLKSYISEIESKLNWLTERIATAQQRRFGASSEKSVYDGASQMTLFENIFNEAETLANNDPEPELSEVKSHYRRAKREKKDRLPEDLPVETVQHELSEAEQICPCCGERMHEMGHTITREELKLVPAQASIIQHVQTTYSCRNCEKNETSVPIRKSHVPNAVIKGGFATPEAVAHIATQKFVMGSPLYRQEREWNRHGIMLSRQTMSNWLIKATEDWLVPIYKVLHDKLLKSSILHVDETTLQVLKEPSKTSQSKSYMWLYRTGSDAREHIVLYEYQPDRRKERAQTFLTGFEGYVHTDGYSVYSDLAPGITAVGCWAHARRKFDEALRLLREDRIPGSPELTGKRYCDAMFKLEQKFAELPTTDNFKARFEARHAQLKPMIDEFFAWVESLFVIPKSTFGTAVRYVVKQKPKLKRVLLDGRLELSNNRAERSIKPFVIDRKNFMFANTPRGASASAVLFSLIESAKENGIDPYAYLSRVFRDAPNGNFAGSLLPWAV
ncbi:transposase [Clostridia bacterium]|nr:transposase [Clostridia bacterium]